METKLRLFYLHPQTMPRSLFALKRSSFSKILNSKKEALTLYTQLYTMEILKPWEFLSPKEVFVLETANQEKFWLFASEKAFHMAVHWPDYIISVYYCTGNGIISKETEEEMKQFGLWKNNINFSIPIPVRYNSENPFQMPSRTDLENFSLGLQVMILHLQKIKSNLIANSISLNSIILTNETKAQGVNSSKQAGQNTNRDSRSKHGTPNNINSSSKSKDQTDCRGTEDFYRVVWKGERIRTSIKQIKLRKEPQQDGDGNTKQAHIFSREFVEANMRGELLSWNDTSWEIYS